jgi:hypothetical protein
MSVLTFRLRCAAKTLQNTCQYPLLIYVKWEPEVFLVFAAAHESGNGPGRVKIAWEARNWGFDGAFCAHRDSDSTESTSGQPRRAQRLPAGVDLLAQTQPDPKAAWNNYFEE